MILEIGMNGGPALSARRGLRGRLGSKQGATAARLPATVVDIIPDSVSSSDTTDTSSLNADSAGEASHPLESLIGSRIGPYIVRRKIGQGGYGAVFEAEHESIGQRAAIKVLDPKHSGERKATERFLNEARATGIIRHPGLVKVYDYQKTSDDLVCLIMEFLEGESLGKCISGLRTRKERMPMARVLEIIRQVGSALQAVHAANIVHCDLKPDNIFLVPDPAVPGGERVKLLDFGIAKFLTQSVGQTTTTNLILGSPRYMAPEQCEGREELSNKADVYALGIILYELLAGERPFNATTPAALLRQHIGMKPPPLRERAPGVSEDLAALVHDMLAKDFSLRPAMGEVLARLDGDGARGKRLRRRVRVLGLSLLLLLLLLTGWGLMGRRATSRPPAPGKQDAAPLLASPPSGVVAPPSTPPPPAADAPRTVPSVPTTAPPAPTAVVATPVSPPTASPAAPPPAKKRPRATAKREPNVPAETPSPSGESQKGILKTVNFGKD